jgi:alpha-tubulin suppressor-like RCC1 family protein
MKALSGSGHGTSCLGYAALFLLVGAQSACKDQAPDRTIWAALDAGGAHNCALSTEGEAYCWGGVSGWMADEPPTMPMSAIPVAEGAGIRFKALSAGATRCAIDLADRAWCWGDGYRGQVGDGTSTSKVNPAAVAGDLRWRTLSVGVLHACGITLDGDTYCWGNGFRGALGNGSYHIFWSTVPTRVLGGLHFVSVTAGLAASCGLTAAGKAYCWGANESGQLGNLQPEINVAVPLPVAGDHTFRSITLGGGHTCGIDDAGLAWCWGGNNGAQLGNPFPGPRNEPVAVSSTVRFQKLAAGHAFVCGLDEEGQLYCWGDNTYGQFGNGRTGTIQPPQPVLPSMRFIDVSAGGGNTCALDAGNTAYCWGKGAEGQLGNGRYSDSRTPQVVGRRRGLIVAP